MQISDLYSPCQICGGTVGVEKVYSAAFEACLSCGAVFSTGNQRMAYDLAEAIKYLSNTGTKIRSTSKNLTISQSWRELTTLIVLSVSALGFSYFYLSYASIWFLMFAGLSVLAFITMWVNHTVLLITKTNISVESGPISLRKNQFFQTREIKRIYCQGSFGKFTTYNLVAILTTDQRVPLLTGKTNPASVVYLADFIELWIQNLR